MRKISFYILVSLLTFGIGAYFGIKSLFEYPIENVASPETFLYEKMPKVIFPPMEIPPKPDKINFQKSKNEYEEYKRIESENKKRLVLEKLKALLNYKNTKGKQTIYLSKDSVYSYWVEDKSIYLVETLMVENIESSLIKAQIDLTKNVVPTGKYDNLGCCLVEKDWADEVIKKCKKGRKIIL